MHQNILVFYKGKAKDIPKHFKKIEFTEDELSAFDSEINITEENTDE